MSIFRKSKLTEALQAALDQNRDLFRNCEEQRRRAEWNEAQLMSVRAQLDGAEEALAEAQDMNRKLNDELKGLQEINNDLQADQETLLKIIDNNTDVLETLDAQNQKACRFVDDLQDLAAKDYAAWRNDWVKAREAEALEDENLRLWAENAILRGRLAQMDAAAGKECVSDRP